MDIRQWLANIGMEQYAESFEENELTVEDLAELTSDDLKEELGITKLIHRKKILAAIGGAKESPPAQATSPVSIEYPTGLHPDQMPTYLAHPWRSLCLEDHPRVKLHWLTDTAELAVRWSVAVALAEILYAHDSTLPRSMANTIRDNIQRPTLGRWLGILRNLTQGKPKDPAVAPDVFDLYEKTFEPRFKTPNQGGTIHNSLLVMRNQIAHGGGMSRAHADELLATFIPEIENLLREVMTVTNQAQIYSVNTGGILHLTGLSPAIVEPPSNLQKVNTGTWLTTDEHALPMLPLVIFGPVKVIDNSGEIKDKPNSDSPQFFTRADTDRLSYTPLGRDEAHSEILEVELFRSIFQLDNEKRDRKKALGDLQLPWDDAIIEARQIAPDLVGRDAEIKHIKKWMKTKNPHETEETRIGWLSGGPGFGKSIIMSKLAADYSAGSHRGFFYHRFRGGNARNNKRTFLRFLQAALWAWEPLAKITTEPDFLAEGDELIDAIEARLKSIASLESHHPKAPKPTFWVLLDGFDDIAGQDEGMVDLVRKFAVPGTLWLVGGRPEHGLNDHFSRPGSENIFPDGLPPMSAQDIRAMLLEGLGNARYALLKRDADTADGEGVQNQFIERVVENAKGLPLYVHLLLDDLRSGNLTVQDDEKLPDGLTAYYDALMDRVGLSSVKRDLPFIVCALALAKEPLDADALATLTATMLEDVEEYLPRIKAALRVGQALLRKTSTPDGTEGYTLYHQSFQEYITGKPAHGTAAEVKPAPALADTLREAQRKLFRMTARWNELPDGNMANHLFRWGTTYCVQWQGDKGIEQVVERLQTFPYLLARVRALPASAIIDLVAEYDDVLNLLPANDRGPLSIWEAFFRERAHILARGDQQWPAYKILSQLAVEHADNSPITQATESWLNSGGCDWRWLRKVRRPAKIKPNLCIRVFEGHRDELQGCLVIDDERYLSWSKDHDLIIWNANTGEEIERLTGHEDTIDGVLMVNETIAASYSRDNTIRLWDLKLNEPLHTLEGHTKRIVGISLLSDQRLVSWAEDKLIRLWDIESGQELDFLKGHTAKINGAHVLGDDRIISWAKDRSIRIWDTSTCESTTKLFDKVDGHTTEVLGAMLLDPHHVLGWDNEGDIVKWSLEDESIVYKLAGHNVGVLDVARVGDDQLLSWDKEGTLHLWQLGNGEDLLTMEGHTDRVMGVHLFDEQTKAVSWSHDADLRVWDLQSGKCLHHLKGHASRVHDTIVLIGDKPRALSSSGGGDLRLWDLTTGKCLAILDGHTAGVKGALALADETFLSWSWDKTLRLWALRDVEVVEDTIGHRGWINMTRKVDETHLLSYSADGDILLWDTETSTPQIHYSGHTKSVSTARMDRDNATFVSIGGEFALKRWQQSTGECLATYEGHTKKVQDFTFVGDDQLLSWSSDATIKLWDKQSGECLHTFEGHKKLVQGAFLWDDTTLVSWSSDGTIRLWDVANKTALATLDDHGKNVKGVRKLDDGRLLSWSSDKTLKLWDVPSKQCVQTLEGHTGIVEEAIVKDRFALSFSKDLTIRYWDLNEGQCIHVLEGDDEESKGGLILEDRLITWSKKLRRYTEWHRHTGELIGRVDYQTAIFERGDIWRARFERTNNPNLQAQFRLQGYEGGATLFLDTDEDTIPVVSWRESGLWQSDALHEGALSVHAGNDLQHLHIFDGTSRVMLSNIDVQ